MNFDGSTRTHPDHILDSWRSYFENLYSFSSDREFDDDFKTHIEAEVPNLLISDENSVSRSLSTPVTYCELLTIVKSLPNGKSPSSDHITYEHITFGGHTLSKWLCQLFTSILRQECVPSAFKQSITVTLHNGNGKPKTDPNIYRAISLLPVLSKLFEKVLLSRIEKCGVTSSLNPLHFGFQRGKSSKMTFFIYQKLLTTA